MEKNQKPIPSHINNFFDWLKINKLENLNPHELSPDHIWQYRVFLSRHSSTSQNAPLKKSTQNYYLIALRSLLNYFANRDILSLPSEKIKLARDKEDRQVRFLTLE